MGVLHGMPYFMGGDGSGGNADLSSLGTTSTQIVNSLIAGADPIVKIDHS